MWNLSSNKNRFLIIAIIGILLLSPVAVFKSFGDQSLYLSASPLAPNSDTQVRLSWTSVANASFYAVYRNGLQVAFIDVNRTKEYLSYSDTGLIPETQYTYTLRVLDSGMRELQNTSTTVTTSRMQSPSNVTALYNPSSNTITLTWTINSTAATRSVIKRVNGPEIATVYYASSYVFTDPEYDGNQTFQYVVISMDDSGHSSAPSLPAAIGSASGSSNIPYITASVDNGTCTIRWPVTASNVYNMALERSRFDGYSWSSWSIVNPSVSYSGGSISDTPSTAGTYRYRLYIYSPDYSGYTNMTDPVHKPAAPSDLSCTILQSGAIYLSWVNDLYNDCKLRIERKTDSGNFQLIALLDSASTSYIDTFTLSPGITYTYRLSAFDSDNNISIGTEYSISTVSPDAPSFLSLTVVSENRIDLFWKDHSSNEQGFVIERKVDSGDYYELAKVPANTTGYIDTDILPGHIYVYRIYSYNPFGNSPYSNEVWSSSSSIITPPDSLVISGITSTSVNLSWTYPSGVKSCTVLERKEGINGKWIEIRSISSGVTTYTDTGLKPDTQYFYRVKAASGAYVFSIPYPYDHEGKAVRTLLGRPSLLEAYASSSTQISLSWIFNHKANDFVIERKSIGGTFEIVAYTPSNVTSWIDWGLAPDTKYTYRIKARDLDNSSEYSDEVTVTTKFLAPPTDFKAIAVSPSSVEMVWSDNSTGKTGYEIWRKNGEEGQWQKTATVKYSLKYTDNNVDKDTKYYYKVRAYSLTSNGDTCYSAFTDAVPVLTSQSPAPSDLKATILSSDRVNISWQAPNSDAAFIVERMDSRYESWQEIARLPSGVRNFEDSGLEEHIIYYYRIKSLDLSCNSLSTPVEVKVMTDAPESPSNPSARALSSTSISVTWTDASDTELGYIIERKPQNGEYAMAGKVSANSTRFVDTSLQPGIRYYYRIKAFNQSGESEYSREVYASTYSPVSYDDIISLDWARNEIENLASMGAIKGRTESLFMPDASITRAEFTSLLVKALNLKKVPVGTFADVKPGYWAYNEIMTAKMLGIVSGDSSTSFYPDSPISREDMALMIVKALKASGTPLPGYNVSILDKYEDKNSISPNALSSFASLVGEGILPVKNASVLGPMENVTRAEAAVVVYRVISR